MQLLLRLINSRVYFDALIVYSYCTNSVLVGLARTKCWSGCANESPRSHVSGDVDVDVDVDDVVVDVDVDRSLPLVRSSENSQNMLHPYRKRTRKAIPTIPTTLGAVRGLSRRLS